MSGAEARAIEIDTTLLHPELLGIAGGHAWVREAARNLLVAFDVESGRESFRKEGALRVHVFEEIVVLERGGEVTALDPTSGEARRVGERPAHDLLGATARHLWCAHVRDRAVALDLVTGAATNEVQLGAAPLPGVAMLAGEVAFRLRDGNVAVLAVDGRKARVARVLDVQRAPRDAVLPPIATPIGLLVPVVEATVQGPRTRLLALDDGALAVRAEADFAAQVVRAHGALVALSAGERTIVIDATRRLELPGALVALRDPYVITRRGDACLFGVLTAATAARVALPAVPGAREGVLGPRTAAWRVESRLGLLPLASIPLVDGAAVRLSIETRSETESAEVTFVSPRGIVSLMSPRFGGLTALVPDVTGWKKGDRVALLETSALPGSRTVRAVQRIAPGAASAIVTHRSLAVAGAPFEPIRAEPGVDPARILAALGARLAEHRASVPDALVRLVHAHHAPRFAKRLADAAGILLVEPREREGRVVFATTPAGHVSFELVAHEGALAVVGWSRRTGTALFEAITVEAFLAQRLARRKQTAASSVATVASEIEVRPEDATPAARWAPSWLLDRLLPMRRAPDHAALEARLGLPMGPTLRALVEMAYRVCPDAPSDAFACVSFYLDWIDPDGPSAESMRFGSMTPREILPFAMTRGDGHHMGFLLDGTDRLADERPIVFVVKDWPPAHVVARDLPSFLGLVAHGGADDIERDREPSRVIPEEEPISHGEDGEPDEPQTPEWHAPSAYYAARFLEMIPGVARPVRWADVTEAVPDRAFTYDE